MGTPTHGNYVDNLPDLSDSIVHIVREFEKDHPDDPELVKAFTKEALKIKNQISRAMVMTGDIHADDIGNFLIPESELT